MTKPTIKLTCDQCSASFERSVSLAAKRGVRGTFCSRACFLARVARCCEQCGANFTVTRFRASERPARYCSPKCRGDARSPAPIQCEHCGVTFERAGRAPSSRFCSHRCYSDWMVATGAVAGENGPNWRGGVSWANRLRGPDWRRQRQKAIARDGGKCVRCGALRDQVHRLVVHHLIPYRSFGGDHVAANDLSNLVTLCDCCHTTVEWQITRGERLF
jgi:5-methylcytosine-specific restriction endonuclease McrA